MERFDVVVVGGGLMGSSAARHLVDAGHRVALVAAPEPTDWTTSGGPFASHYDAGRITRVIANDPVWAELAVRSIERYSEIESRSGITFHDPRGLAWLGIGIEAAVTSSQERAGGARMVSPDWLYATTGIRMPSTPGLECAFEPGPAGVVNPRRLAAAQTAIAKAGGATIFASAAQRITPMPSGVAVTGSFGQVQGDQLLLATGAYAAELAGVDLELNRLLRTTLRVDMGPAPEMPSLIIEPVEHPHTSDVYWNPPVRYPDGRTLFKIGCERAGAPRIDSSAELPAWFQGTGDPAEADALLSISRDLLPGADFRSWDSVPCVITRTAHGYPYLGWIDDRVAVAIGGNGSSAKSCDEIGRLASTLFGPSGWVDSALSAETFRPITA